MNKITSMRINFYRKTAIIFTILLFIGTIVAPITGEVANKYNKGSSEKSVDLNGDAHFDTFIEWIMKLNCMPSLSACIIKNNSIVWAKAYGLCDIENNKTATVDTQYMLGSISKTITATALMQLYEKGYFNLDDNVSKFLPFDLKNPNYPNVNITFRMLLAHQSSLGDRMDLFLTKYPGDPDIPGYPYPLLKDILVPGGKNYTDKVWTKVRPGEKLHYSNLGYALIGYLVERISGEKFEEYCKKHIFETLGMYNTSFRLRDLDIDKIAVPYELHPKSILFGKLVPFEQYGIFGYPAGSARSSVIEFSRFIIAHMNGGVYNGVRILNETTVKLMHTVQYPDSWFESDFRFYQYGLGWEIWKNMHGETFICHSGHHTTSSALVKIRLSDNVAIVYFMNRRVNTRVSGIMAEHLIAYALFEKADEL